MKTLQQIFEEQGSVFPFRVKYHTWLGDGFVELRYKYGDFFYGHCCEGFSHSASCSETRYTPYTEPKKKVKLWPYLVQDCASYVLVYGSDALTHYEGVPVIAHPTMEPIEIEAQDD